MDYQRLYELSEQDCRALERQLEEIYAGLRKKGWEEVHMYQCTPAYLELGMRPSDQPTRWWNNRDLQRQLEEKDAQEKKILLIRKFVEKIITAENRPPCGILWAANEIRNFIDGETQNLAL